MIDYILQNKKLSAIIGILLIVSICLYGFVTTYSFLKINSVNPGFKTIYVSTGDGTIKKQFDIEEGSKTYLLKRDRYTIKAVSGSKQSVYKKNLGMLSRNTVSVELKDQLASEYMGISNLPCSKQRENASPVFYSCNPSTYGVVSDQESSDTPLELNLDETYDGGQSLKPYRDGFLRAAASDKKLLLEKVSNTGNVTARVNVGDFSGSINDRYFSTSETSQTFSIFNSDKNEIWKFNDTEQKQPTILKIPEGVINVNQNNVRLISGDTYTYLVSYTDELHHGDDHKEGDEDETLDQMLLIFDNKSNELVKKSALPSNWFISNVSDSYNDRVMLFVSTEIGNGQTYLINGQQSIKEIELGAGTPQELCWINNSSFYYLANEGQNIFEYSLSGTASYLTYGGLASGTSVTSISCDKGKLSFVIKSGVDGIENGNLHYTLTTRPYTGIRPESVLPLYMDVGGNAYEVKNGKLGKIDVRLFYGSSPSDPIKVSDGVMEQLKQQGVSSDKNTLRFVN